ncbi:MAG: hypothetical protein HC904_17560 [Blastochloris sp.]|nr:hypothetical protein [Blastochloris sp.]
MSELMKVEHGFAFKGEHFSESGELVVLTPGNFHEAGGFRARPDKDRFYLGKFPDRYLLQQNDLIVAMTEQGEGLLGSSALIPESGKYLHNQRIGLVRPKNDSADKTFLYYLFNTDYVRQQIRNSSAGAKIRHTSPERIYRTKVRVPEKTCQSKIAAILSAYDELIENNRRRIALLEKLAEEIYREWFVRLRFPGHEKVKHVKGIPLGWRVALLSELAYVNPSSLSRRDHPETIRYLDISSVSTNRIEEVTTYAFKDAPGRARRRVQHGDIIWSSVRPANRAYCLIYEPEDNLIASTGFAVIRPKCVTPFTFLFQAVTSNPFVDQMTTVAKGAAYPATSFDDFEKAKLLVSPDELLKAYHEMAEPLFRQKHLLQQQNAALRKSRDLLLPRLISGKLSVEHLNIQFPPAMGIAPKRSFVNISQ